MSACEETQGPHALDPAATIRESEAGPARLHDLAAKPVQTEAIGQAGSRPVASYREFAAALTEIGLIGAAELERFAADSTEGVLGLSRALVKAGKLTPYQAAAVYQNKSRGLLIGNYLILDKVGQGGMGMVFKARHRKLGRLGALKILPPSFTRDPGAVKRFRREFEAAGRLKHLNLVAAFEADEDRGVHFLVMDYVEGINLERVVREQGPLPVSEAVDYLIQSARGLEAAHEKGIIHRDIKPGNLMLDRGGTVRVLDLGLARIVDASNPFSKTVAGRLTQSGTYMGTVDYMAPEQAEDSHSVDHRADIYSLGCTVFFLLTGREAFAGASILKRMVAHQEHPAPSLRAIRPDVSPALEAAYQKMMAKSPKDRPASMSEVIALLQASKLSADTSTGHAAPPPEPWIAPEVSNEMPMKRGGPPRTIIDSGIFDRRVEGEGTLTEGELNLWDLVMDVRSEVNATGGEPHADPGEREGAVEDRELSLRELAMELGAEPASPAAPKPLAAVAPPLKRAASPREEATPPAALKLPAANVQPLKRATPPRREEMPPAAPKPPAAERQPLHRSALTPQAEGPPAAERQPLHQSALSPQAERLPAAPKPLAAERQTLKTPAPTLSGGLAQSKGLAILAVLTAILLVVAIVVSISRRPAAVIEKRSATPARDSSASENHSEVAPAPQEHREP
jgi:serine/threonine protein kinase